jgi:hypothetical protein
VHTLSNVGKGTCLQTDNAAFEDRNVAEIVNCSQLLMVSCCRRCGSRTCISSTLLGNASNFVAETTGSTGGLWVDQTCIDQKDEGEKEAVVGNVDLIYMHARGGCLSLSMLRISPDQKSKA